MASGQGSGDGFRKCIRLAMILANLLILIGAFSILAVGIWTIVDKSYLQDLMRNKLYMSAAYVLIAVGAITIILSLIGCLGSFTEKRLLLLAYFLFVLLMFVVLLLGGAFAYVFREQIKNNMKPAMMDTIRDYDPSKPENPITKAWDATQNKLQCCGISTNNTGLNRPWKSWKTNLIINSGEASAKVPASCCKLDENGAKVDCSSENPVDEDKIFTKDCFGEAVVFVKGHAVIIGGVAMGIAAIMILGMVFAICLYKLIARST